MGLKKPTLLILGAGASMPYGFPTGPELIDRIMVASLEQDGPMRVDLRNAGVHDAEITSFRTALGQTQLASIDEFLGHHSEFLKVGKLAIAAALIPYEISQRLLTPPFPEQHWYRFLFQQLVDPHGFNASKLTVITLNYDRSLEHYLYLTVSQDFKMPPDEAARAVQKATFIHFHGRLGWLPWWIGERQKCVREYHTEVTPDILTAAAAEIRIVSEGSVDPEFAYLVNTTVQEAEVIGFLGFGYHPVVMNRLESQSLRERPAGLFGSAFQLPEGRQGQLKDSLPSLLLGADALNVFQFLQKSRLLYQ